MNTQTLKSQLSFTPFFKSGQYIEVLYTLAGFCIMPRAQTQSMQLKWYQNAPAQVMSTTYELKMAM